MVKHVNIRIFGLVQGVFFRVSAKEMAEKLNIKGFARNESDNSVYIEAEGEENELNKFMAWCQEGPVMSQVDKVGQTEGSLQNFLDFKIY